MDPLGPQTLNPIILHGPFGTINPKPYNPTWTLWDHGLALQEKLSNEQRERIVRDAVNLIENQILGSGLGVDGFRGLGFRELGFRGLGIGGFGELGV